MWLRSFVAGLAFAAIGIGTACAARKPGDPLKPGFNVYSKQQDVELGRQVSVEVEKQVVLVRDGELQSYIAGLGRSLARHDRTGGFPYSFKMVHEDSINAFALPGGPIYVHTGLVKAVENEGQLAGVLAHEIGHVALRHSTNQASKANLIGLPAAMAAAVIGQGSAGAQAGQIGLGLGVNTVLLKYSRDAERQSDAYGARLMSEAGYNPLEMARFFEKLQEQGGSRAPQFLSSHPEPGGRSEAVEAEIRTMPRRSYGSGTGQLSGMQRRIERLPAPKQRR